MAKTATHTDTPSKKKAHDPEQTHKEKSQQEKKTSTAHKADEKKAHASAQNDEKQKRKEHAKQEAKLMLKTEQAKKDVQKAEQKLAKAQKRLEDARTQQQGIEQKLAELRTAQQTEVSHNGVPAASDEPLTTLAQVENAPVAEDTALSLKTPFIEQSADTTDTTQTQDTLVVEAQNMPTGSSEPTAEDTSATNPQTEQPPAEGRTDIPDASQEASTPTSKDAEETQIAQEPATDTENIEIGTDVASMPLLSHNDTTWPPPLIREEVAEAAKEVEASDSAHTQNVSTDAEETHTSNASNENEAEETPHRRSSITSRRTRKTTE